MDFLVNDLQTTTLTKAHLADLLFDDIGLSKREANDMIDAVFQLMLERLVQGEDVKLSNFGNFQVRTKNARPGRNPRTGEAVPVPPRRVPVFKVSKELKDMVAQG